MAFLRSFPFPIIYLLLLLSLPNVASAERLANAADSDDNIAKVVYTVQGNTLQRLSGEPFAMDQEIWQHFTALIPPAARADIKQFVAYADADDALMAYVEEMDEDDNAWRLAVNMEGDLFDNDGAMQSWSEFNFTVIHEVAHVLTLHRRQYDDRSGEQDCRTYFDGEVCAWQHSYINRFIGLFWSQQDVDASVAYRASKSEDDPPLYTQHPDRFISAYAASDPGEDIAESFAQFVLKPRPQDSFIVKNQKVIFFYGFADLVKLRQEIRQRHAALQ